MAATDYERYIRTDELLALQKPLESLSCHDELQFQVVHQVAELWMKLVDHEVRHVAALLGQDRVLPAVPLLRRVARIQRLLVAQMDLLDTMTPVDYMRIREGLGRGSGQESPGFHALLRLPGQVLWPAFSALLERRGATVRSIYERPTDHPELHQLAEGLVEYDQNLQNWRQRHLLLVYRIIGAGTPSLKGKHSEMLERGARQRFFPELWQVRDELYADWNAARASNTDNAEE